MSFPSAIGMGKYSVVKISAIPSYVDSDIPKILNEYALIFETLYSNDKMINGLTTIDIVPINTLPLFNGYVEDASKFEYKGGGLVINEFVEIIEEKSTYGKQYVAVLKKQVSKEKKYICDKNILLCEDNGEGYKRLDNIPIVQLGPEFKAKITQYNEKEKLNDVREVNEYLSIMQYHTKNEDDKVTIARCIELVEKELRFQEDREEKAFYDYINILNLSK